MPTRDNIVRHEPPIPETAPNLHGFSFGGCSGSLLARNPTILSSSTVSWWSAQSAIVQLPPQTLAMAARSRILTVMSLMDTMKVGTLRSAGLNSVNTIPALVIYPSDWKQYPRNQGVVVDDRMHEIMVQPLPAGCRLTVSYYC